MPSASPPRAGSAAIFLLALGVLVLEVALPRIFSVMTYPHFTYLLIGFVTAGTLLTVHRRYAGPAVQPRVLAAACKYDPVRCVRGFNTILRADGDAFNRQVDQYPYVIRPGTDDALFFFNDYRLANLRHPFKTTLVYFAATGTASSPSKSCSSKTWRPRLFNGRYPVQPARLLWVGQLSRQTPD